MRVTLVQAESPAGESVPARRDRVGRMVREARGADLVVLPELWHVGYFDFERYDTAAEPLHGDTVQAAAEWARDLGALLHLGSIVERAPDGRLYNTAVLLGPDGTIAHTYRKIHVFGHESLEARLLTPGDSVGVIPSPLGVLGVTTCYDLRFPELWRRLLDAGAETVVTPAAWPASRLAHWRTLTTARAIEEQIHLVACNAAGTQAGGAVLGGHSRIVDPTGEVLVEAGPAESVVSAEIDPERVDAVREGFPVLKDRVLQFGTTVHRAHPSPKEAPCGLATST